MKFRVFKENCVRDDERTVSDLHEAATIYKQYFESGYTVRVAEVETGIEYAMGENRLIRIPYSRERQAKGLTPRFANHA